MKEKLQQQLIELKGKRAFYITKYKNATFFWRKWEALIEECDAKIKEIKTYLEMI